LKNNSLFRVYSKILQKGPWTLRKLTRGLDFALRPLEFEKIIPKSSPASEKSTKITLKLQNSISFKPQLQI
jgi:hypothetical protein